MSHKHSFTSVVLAAFLTMGPAHAAPPDMSNAKKFEYAHQLFTQRQWSGAYGLFAELADRGHSEAARIALFMVRHGPQLFNSAWSASEMQIKKWCQLSCGDATNFAASGAD